MKKILLLLVTATLFISCKSDDETSTPEDVSLIGNWRLIEYLADPGDGSGIFLPIDSDKTVTFNPNGEITSNYSLCNMYVITEPQNSSGTYSTTSGMIEIPNCYDTEPRNLSFEISEEGNLILHYLCIEGCSEKYIKI